MQIRTRLAIISAVAAIGSILTLSVLAWTHTQLRRTTSEHDLVEELIDTQIKRVAVRDKYFLFHDERPKQQWLQADRALFGSPPTGADHLSASPRTATPVAGNRRLSGADEGTLPALGRKPGRTGQRQRQQRTGTGNRTTAAFADHPRCPGPGGAAVQLQDISDREHAAQQTRSELFILVSVLLLAGFTVSSSMIVARSIA